MPRPASNAYLEAVKEARAAENRLRLLSLRRLDAALQEYISNLTRLIRLLPNTTEMSGRREAAKRSLEIARRQYVDLTTRMEQAVGQSRSIAFDQVLAMHNDATYQVARSHEIPNRLLGAVQKPNIMLAGAWESLGTGASTWRTLLRGYTRQAIEDAQHVMTSALMSGMSPDELAKRLRPYLQGSEPFQEAFRGAGEITDQMLNDPRFTGAAKLLRYNADRIAMSEIHNARGEAELQAFASDPFVEYVQWTLSPGRGTQSGSDACDAFAKTDWFGLGAGIYPVTKVPAFPHPFCRCERVPIPRPMSRMNDPKPNPSRRDFVTVKVSGVTKSQRERIQVIADRSFSVAERTVEQPLASLDTQQQTAARAPTRSASGSPITGADRRAPAKGLERTPGAVFYPTATDGVPLTADAISVRSITQGLKTGDAGAIKLAAPSMAVRIPDNAILIPLPNSSGLTDANRALADEIARLKPSAEVHDVVGRQYKTESSRKLRQAGGVGLTAQAQAESMKKLGEIPAGRPVFFVDNIEVTGNTAEGARRALRLRSARSLTFSFGAIPEKERFTASLIRPKR